MKHTGYLALMVITGLIVGCSSPFATPVAVSGKVTYKGKAVDGAVVTFLPKDTASRSASGTTDSEGNFELTTFKTDDGALPGDYTVTIAKFDASKAQSSSTSVDEDMYGADYGAMMDGAAAGKSAAELYGNELPEKYGDAAQSGLTRSVAEGQPNEFDFDLE